MAIDRFAGEYIFPSNFYKSPIKYKGIIYPTVEHAFQAAKSQDPDDREFIAKLPNAREAKIAGRKVCLKRDWEDTKIDIMYSLLKLKFANSFLKEKLLATGKRELIEGNFWKDKFWGVYEGYGENHLGKLLMKVRDFYNEEGEEE